GDKLAVAAGGGAFIGLIWTGIPWVFLKFISVADIKIGPDAANWISRLLLLATTFLAIVVLAWTKNLLTPMTFLELSHMRRIKISEAMRGIATPGIRLTLAYLLLLGGAFLIMSVLHWAPGLFAENSDGQPPGTLARIIAAGISIVGLAIEVSLWLLVG